MMVKMLTEERPGRVVVAWDPGKTFRHEAGADLQGQPRSHARPAREQSAHFRPLMEAFGFVNTESRASRPTTCSGRSPARAEARRPGRRDPHRRPRRLPARRATACSVMATGRGVTDTTLYTPEAVRRALRHRPGADARLPRHGGRPERQPARASRASARRAPRSCCRSTARSRRSSRTPSSRRPSASEALTEHADDARKTRDLAVIRTDAPVDLDLGRRAPARLRPRAHGGAARDCSSASSSAACCAGWRSWPTAAPPGAAAPRPRTVAAVAAVAGRARGPRRCASRAPGAWRSRSRTRAGRSAASGDEVGRRRDGRGHRRRRSPRALGGRRGRVPRREVGGARDRRRPAPRARHDDRRLPARPAPPRLPARRARRRARASASEGEPAGLRARRRPGARAGRAPARGARRARAWSALYRDIELPVTRVLAAMERAGVRLDVHRLGEIARPRARPRRRAARPDLGAGGRRVRHRLAQAARRGALRAARPADLPQGQDRLEHRPQGAAAAGRTSTRSSS